MAALLFPSLDALRLVLASGVAPRTATGTPARAETDEQGCVRIETDAALTRETLAALARFGVQAARGEGRASQSVRSWAELLPLRPSPASCEPRPVLFELPDAFLARFVGRRRLAADPFRIALLLGEGRSWVHCERPASNMLLQADDPGSLVEAFWEQAPRMWVSLGWSHPQPDHLVVPENGSMFLRPSRGIALRTESPPSPRFEEYTLFNELGPYALEASSPPSAAAVPIRLKLQSSSKTPREVAWVFTGQSASGFWDFCAGANERILRQFEVATVTSRGSPRVIVRPLPGLRMPPFLPLAAAGYYADPGVPGLYLPSRRIIRPAIRPRVLARLLGAAPDRFTWLEATENGSIVPRALSVAAFHPARSLLAYAAPEAVRFEAEQPRLAPFAFEKIVLASSDEPREIAVEAPQQAPFAPVLPAQKFEEKPGWVARSLGRLFKPFLRVDRDSSLPSSDRDKPSPRPATGSAARAERKLASHDALLHGQDRAARRRELEAGLLGDFRRQSPEIRAKGWAELAEVYAATGNPADASICWINAIWDSPTPTPELLDQWLEAEGRAARQTGRALSLDRWLSEPGRFGSGRVVAAYAVRGAFGAAPPNDLVAALPRVLAFLDHHFDDLPARAAWLARLAATQLCSGDALGLARWRDRILARLRDKGPGLDLDEPSFLRFHGMASPDRFQTAREWLVRTHKPILEWVARLGAPGKLQWAGLDPETDCTAAYAQQMLAWGLGCLGERTRSRDWAARARKVLTHAAGPNLDPAVHTLLADAFQERIRDVQEGRLAKPGFPPHLRERLDQLTDSQLGRYAVDKLRRHSRILEPGGFGRDYGGLDLRGFRGLDQLGERLQLLADRTDPAILAEEARQVLAECAAAPSSANVPRAALTLLDLAPQLEAPLIGPILELAVPAANWMEAWFEAGAWSEAVKADRLPRYLTRLLEGAFTAAAWSNHWPAARPLVEFLLERGGSDPALRTAIGRTAGSLFRSLRKLGYRVEAESLLHLLDPSRGDWPADSPSFPASRFGLAVGWFAVGDEETGTRILDDARNRLFVARTGDARDRTELAIAYAEALGFAPPRLALGRLEEIFQLLDRVAVTGATNRYFTLRPLRLIETVIRSVVTDDFALGPAVRGWLDDDEFLIRRRIHRDMAAVLHAGGVG